MEKHELEYIDQRDQGGLTWVIGDRKIESYLKPLDDFGIRFRFKPNGSEVFNSRAT